MTLAADPPAFELTDVGNAERLVDRHGADLRFSAKHGGWFHWTGCRFEVDDSGAITRKATETLRAMKHAASDMADPDRAKSLWKHAHRSENNNRVKAMIELAQAQATVSVAPAALDADPWLFNCANCTIELRTGTPRNHRRENLITKLANVRYTPDARAPTWDGFLRRVMSGDEEMIGYLQRVAGQCLTGDISVQEIYIPYGPGANGKSVWCDTLVALSATTPGSRPKAC